jgi:hypothetical protein
MEREERSEVVSAGDEWSVGSGSKKRANMEGKERCGCLQGGAGVSEGRGAGNPHGCAMIPSPALAKASLGRTNPP